MQTTNTDSHADRFSNEGAPLPITGQQIQEFIPESFIVDHSHNLRFKPRDQQSSHSPDAIRQLAGGILMGYSRRDPSRPATDSVTIDADGNLTADQEKVAATVPNYLHGQQSPVRFVIDPPTKKPRLRFGFGRVMATSLLNEEPEQFKELLNERLGLTPEQIHNGEFSFTVRAVEGDPGVSDDMDNVIENAARSELSDMDWAIVCKRMADCGGPGGAPLSYPAVADKLAPMRPTGKDKCSSSWVQQHIELLSLTPEIQEQIHAGKLSVWRGIEILRSTRKDAEKALEEGTLAADDIDSEEAAAFMAEQQNKLLGEMKDPETGEVDRKRARQVTRAKSEEAGAPNTKTISELKRALKEQIEICRSKAATKVLAYLEGKLTDAAFVSFLQQSGDPEMLEAAKKAKKSAKSGSEKAAEKAAKGEVNLPPKKAGAKKAGKKAAKKAGAKRSKAGQTTEAEVKGKAKVEAPAAEPDADEDSELEESMTDADVDAEIDSADEGEDSDEN